MAKRELGESRFYTSDSGLRLHVRDYAPSATRGAAAVCLPGLTRSADDFEPLARFLTDGAEATRRVLCFDYRGRGLSDHDPDWRHYDLATEWRDVLTGMQLYGVGSAHFIGTSRGGLHIMAAAASCRAMIRSAVLNDIGPVLELAGLRRIQAYVGQPVSPRDLTQAVQILKIGVGRSFTDLSEAEWGLFARTTFGTDEAALALRYDPALRHILDAMDLAEPLPNLWSQFDALQGLPVLAIRGGNSDLLSQATAAAMAERWPGCETLTVAGQGHAPLLADDTSLRRIATFLEAADR